MMTATGNFSVTMASQPTSQGLESYALNKLFRGDLTGPSVGFMIAIRTATAGSAGYVAMETFTGSLAGRSGSFVLQHYGIMNRHVPMLNVVVVPDSATDDLAGLIGTMTIDAAADHHYVLSYELA